MYIIIINLYIYIYNIYKYLFIYNMGIHNWLCWLLTSVGYVAFLKVLALCWVYGIISDFWRLFYLEFWGYIGLLEVLLFSSGYIWFSDVLGLCQVLGGSVVFFGLYLVFGSYVVILGFLEDYVWVYVVYMDALEFMFWKKSEKTEIHFREISGPS